RERGSPATESALGTPLGSSRRNSDGQPRSRTRRELDAVACGEEEVDECRRCPDQESADDATEDAALSAGGVLVVGRLVTEPPGAGPDDHRGDAGQKPEGGQAIDDLLQGGASGQPAEVRRDLHAVCQDL